MKNHSVIRLAETASTNAYAIELIARQRPTNGTVVITQNQTQGRGLDQNSWESEAGANLTFSIIYYPVIAIEQQFMLNKAIALAISQFLANKLKISHVKIKWPNDIYIGNQKVCGILIQNAITGSKFEYAVVGIGMNVNQVVFRSDAPNPVSLANATGKLFDPEKVLAGLLRYVDDWYQKLCSGEEKLINDEYHEAMYRLNEFAMYEINDKQIKGTITGTDAYGRLCLQTESGEQYKCDLKEVKFVL